MSNLLSIAATRLKDNGVKANRATRRNMLRGVVSAARKVGKNASRKA